MMTLLSVAAWAKVVTIDFDADYATLFPTITGTSSNNSHDGDFTVATTSAEVDGVSVVVTPSGGSTANRIWGSSPRLRMYGGDLIINAPESITKIEYENGKWNANNTIDDVALETGEWSTTETSGHSTVTLKVAGNTQLKKLIITMGNDAPATVDAPVINFDPVKAYVGDEVTATITCATEGATIMYALNDGDFQEYTEALTLTEATTVKAKAVLALPTTSEPVESAVTTKTITFNPTVANIAELTQLASGTEFRFTGNLTVVFTHGSYTYVKDETGYTLIFGYTDGNLAAGNTIYGLTGKVNIYNNLFEVANANYSYDPTDTEVEPIEYALTDITAEKMNQYVLVKNVALSGVNGRNIVLTDTEGNTLAGYSEYFCEFPENLEPKYDVIGFASVFKQTVQIYPVSFTEVVIPEPVITVTPDFGTYNAAQTVKVSVENMPADAVIMYYFVEDEAQNAPRKAEGDIVWNQYDDEAGILISKSGLLTIALNDATGEEITSIEGNYIIDVTTGIEAISGKAVSGVRYYNVAGMASDKAFDGMNIVVTTYGDGTQSVSKVIR